MDRKVKSTKRARNGKIVALCNPDESWSPRKMSDVIGDINSNKRSYYVQELERRTYIRVFEGSLRTTTDTNSKNHLDSLPVS
ncbi:MAG TPA: hypothetical protein VG937_15925 [Polyangiaceae bacterium]|jgi:hypothetical protein|nr:hypothetical protein [Polyangiaceae bacterium]